MTTKYRRRSGVTVLATAAAIGLAACSGTSPPPAGEGAGAATVASLPTSTSGGTRTGGGAGASSTTIPSTGNATALVDEWAACMRHHGDPDQTDPVIDSHGGINIVVPRAVSSHAFGEALHNVTGVCSQYLAAAQRVLRAEIPYTPFDPDEALLVQYTDCMRANGVTNYPYPTGDETNLLGIDMNTPTFIRANEVCGKKIDAPAWWINGWGPPGDVSSTSGPVPGGGPPPSTAVPPTGGDG